jgi:hypothetical protein
MGCQSREPVRDYPLVELWNVSREFDGGQASNTPEVASTAEHLLAALRDATAGG